VGCFVDVGVGATYRIDLWTALCGKPLLDAAWELVETQGLNPPLLKEGPPGVNH
jgi:hypothetical protein